MWQTLRCRRGTNGTSSNQLGRTGWRPRLLEEPRETPSTAHWCDPTASPVQEEPCLESPQPWGLCRAPSPFLGEQSVQDVELQGQGMVSASSPPALCICQISEGRAEGKRGWWGTVGFQGGSSLLHVQRFSRVNPTVLRAQSHPWCCQGSSQRNSAEMRLWRSLAVHRVVSGAF